MKVTAPALQFLLAAAVLTKGCIGGNDDDRRHLRELQPESGGGGNGGGGGGDDFDLSIYIIANDYIAYDAATTTPLGDRLIITGETYDGDNVVLDDVDGGFAGGVQPRVLNMPGETGTSSQICTVLRGDAQTPILEVTCDIFDCFTPDNDCIYSKYMGEFVFDPASGELPPSYTAVIIGGTGDYSEAEGTVVITTVAGRTVPADGNEGNIAITHEYDFTSGGGSTRSGGGGGRGGDSGDGRNNQ